MLIIWTTSFNKYTCTMWIKLLLKGGIVKHHVKNGGGGSVDGTICTFELYIAHLNAHNATKWIIYGLPWRLSERYMHEVTFILETFKIYWKYRIHFILKKYTCMLLLSNVIIFIVTLWTQIVLFNRIIKVVSEYSTIIV